mmetsp:Transcript_30296/g.75954  ORF Transcript_30296/g.75954 Transcript_30296/m.75954 type:complete len:97 (-) Transcript_30296:83-373(-)
MQGQTIWTHEEALCIAEAVKSGKSMKRRKTKLEKSLALSQLRTEQLPDEVPGEKSLSAVVASMGDSVSYNILLYSSTCRPAPHPPPFPYYPLCSIL